MTSRVQSRRYDVSNLVNPTTCVELTVDCKLSKQLQHKDIIYALDTSDKQTNETIESALGWFHDNIIDNTESSRLNHDVLFGFADGVRSYQLSNDIPPIKCSTGKLNIGLLLSTLITYIQGPSVRVQAVVVVLTGVDVTNSRRVLSQRLDELRLICSKKAIEFHTIGIGAIHDAFMLNRLIATGTLPGSYQYIEDPDQLRSALDFVKMRLSDFSVSAAVENNGKHYRVALREVCKYDRYDTRDGTLRGYLYGPLENDSTLKVFTGRGEFNEKLVINDESGSSIKQCDLRINYLFLQMFNMLQYVNTNLNEAGLNSIDDNVDIWQNEVTDIIGIVREQPPLESVAVLEKCIQMRDIIKAFSDAISKLRSEKFTVELFANIQHKIYRFENRTMNSINEQTFDRYADEIVEFVSTFTPSPTDDDFLNKCNAAIMNGDCVCVRIKPGDVITITAEFVNASTYIIDNMLDNTESSDLIFPLYINDDHWFIGKRKIKQLLSIALTNNPLNYNVDMLKILPFKVLDTAIEHTFAENTSEAVFIYNQIILTCRKIFRMLATDEDADWYREFKSKVSTYNMPGNFSRVHVDDNRLMCAQLLAGILEGVMPKFKSPEDANDFFAVMMEEEHRRNLGDKFVNMSNNEAREIIWDILNVDDKYYQPVIDANTKYHEEVVAANEANNGNEFVDYAVKQLALAGLQIDRDDDDDDGETGGKIVMPPTPKYSIESDVTTDGIYKMVQQRLKCDDESLFVSNEKVIGFIKRYIKLFTNCTFKRNAENMLPHVCMVMQNIMQRSKRLRINAIKANGFDENQLMITQNYVTKYVPGTTLNHYIDFVSSGAFVRATIWLRGIYAELTDNRITDAKDALGEITHNSASTPEELMSIVSNTDNILEFIGVLFGSNYGESLHLYINAMSMHGVVKSHPCNWTFPETPIPLFKEKMNILRTGRYRGVVVIPDYKRFSSAPNYTWNPCKRNLYRIYMRNCNAMETSDWVSMFPSIETFSWFD